MVTGEVVDGALRAFDTRGGAIVLDVVEDSDVDDLVPANAPRRLRFRRGGSSLETLVHEREEGLQVVLRLTPPQRFVVRALTRGRGLTVPSATTRSDTVGAAQLTGLPRGVTSLLVEPRDGGALRTAWVRL